MRRSTTDPAGRDHQTTRPRGGSGQISCRVRFRSGSALPSPHATRRFLTLIVARSHLDRRAAAQAGCASRPPPMRQAASTAAYFIREEFRLRFMVPFLLVAPAMGARGNVVNIAAFATPSPLAPLARASPIPYPDGIWCRGVATVYGARIVYIARACPVWPSIRCDGGHVAMVCQHHRRSMTTKSSNGALIRRCATSFVFRWLVPLVA